MLSIKKAANYIIRKVKKPELQQPVLFALAYAITNGKIHSSVPAYLQGLVTRANNSTFEPVGAATAAKQKPLIPYWQWHKASPKVDNIIFAQELSARFGSRATSAISILIGA